MDGLPVSSERDDFRSPPVTASDCWAAVIVPCCHEKPTGNPSNKTPARLECWHRTGARISWHRAVPAELGGHVTQRGMLEADAGLEGGTVGGGQWWGTSEVSGGFGASSLGCSANPRLAGWGEVWGPLCWRGCLSPWSALHLFCQTNLRNDGVLPWHGLKVRYTKFRWISFHFRQQLKKVKEWAVF